MFSREQWQIWKSLTGEQRFIVALYMGYAVYQLLKYLEVM